MIFYSLRHLFLTSFKKNRLNYPKHCPFVVRLSFKTRHIKFILIPPEGVTLSRSSDKSYISYSGFIFYEKCAFFLVKIAL
jgi:hypothetical protein